MNWDEVLKLKPKKVRRPHWPKGFRMEYDAKTGKYSVVVGKGVDGNHVCWPIRFDVDDWEVVEG